MNYACYLMPGGPNSCMGAETARENPSPAISGTPFNTDGAARGGACRCRSARVGVGVARDDVVGRGLGAGGEACGWRRAMALPDDESPAPRDVQRSASCHRSRYGAHGGRMWLSFIDRVLPGVDERADVLDVRHIRRGGPGRSTTRSKSTTSMLERSSRSTSSGFTRSTSRLRTRACLCSSARQSTSLDLA